MSRRIRVEPDAEAELTAAVEWYESQQAGLGFRLLAQAQFVYERIESGEHGAAVPSVNTDARRIAISRFPLWVVFLERENEVAIIAYAHERKRPGYWRGRNREI